MPKGIYKRTKDVWNKGKRGLQVAWNKGKGVKYNPQVLNRAQELFYKNIPSIECNKILTKEFGTKVRANVFWKQLFSKEQRREHRHILCSQSKFGELNPMKDKKISKKVAQANMGRESWCKGIKGEEFLKHYKNNKVGGGRPIGYKHTIESRLKMSQNTIGKKHPNYNPSREQRERCALRMMKNRQDFEFNKKMFASLSQSITKPHRKVLAWVQEHTNLNTISNYPILVGNKYAEIDEADLQNKIAIFIDGNYWHNYPTYGTWDLTVTGFLKNRGWIVLRFWESDINKNPEEVIKKLKGAIPFLDVSKFTTPTTNGATQ